MSNEEIVKEIDNATNAMHEMTREVNNALCHARNVVEKQENAVNKSDFENGVAYGLECTDFEVKEAYNKGLDDAWALARKIFTTDCATLQKALGHSDEGTIIMLLEPQKVLELFEAYEKENEIKVGDVIESIYSGRLGVITMQNKNAHYVLFMDGMAGQLAHDDIKKTGKHIDINSVLEELKW